MIINHMLNGMILQVPSLKLTASLHLKMDGSGQIIAILGIHGLSR